MMALERVPKMSREEVRRRRELIQTELAKLRTKQERLDRELAILQEICKHPNLQNTKTDEWCNDCSYMKRKEET